jgi:hypothetical protein
VFNPKPIPDLSGPKAKLKVSQAREDQKLESFIHGLITEEFDGPEPPKAVLAGLADYVRALEPGACPPQPEAPVSVAALMADARRALAAARGEQAAGDAPAAVVMVAAARSRLGLIDERYADPALARERAAIRAADRRLADLQERLRAKDPAAAAGLAGWASDSRVLEADLAAKEPASLFNPARLTQALRRRLPG